MLKPLTKYKKCQTNKIDKTDSNQKADKVDKTDEIDRNHKLDTKVYKADIKLNLSTFLSILSQ